MNLLRRFYISTLFLPFLMVQCDCAPSSKDENITAFLTTPNDIFWVTAKPINHHKISVKWSLSDLYKREWLLDVYNMAVGQRRVLSTKVHPETDSYTLMGLHPGTSYKVVVSGFQYNGTKGMSDSVIVTTPDEPKSNQTTSAVRQVTATDLYNTDGDVTENVLPHHNKSPGGDDESSGFSGFLKWAVISGCSGLAGLAFFFTLFFIVYKVQKKSDTFRLRRNTKTESISRDNNQSVQVDTDEKDTKEKKDDAEKGQVKEEEKKPKKKENLPTLLALPQLENTRASRSNAYSGISWGSEFEGLEPGDTIYSNDDMNPQFSSQTQSNVRTMPPVFTHSKSMKSHHETIYSNTTLPPTNRPLTRHQSLQSARPPPTGAANTPGTPPPHAEWNSSRGIDIVIPVPNQNQPQKKGVYSNVKNQDAVYVNNGQNDLYVNSDGIDMNFPPPIPRR